MTPKQKDLIEDLATELNWYNGDISSAVFDLTKREIDWPGDADRLTVKEASELIEHMLEEVRFNRF